MKNTKKIIYIIVLIFVFLLCGFGSYKSIKNILSEASAKANMNDANIVSAIEDSLKLISIEGVYEEIITTKQTWVMGLNPSMAWVKVNGIIKVGSQLVNIDKEGNEYIITMSEPKIIDSDLKKEGQWQTKEGILNRFDPTMEGKIFEENKKTIEEKKFEELKQRCMENNNQIIQSFFDVYAKGSSFKINYVKG
jgi:hypothetical protein